MASVIWLDKVYILNSFLFFLDLGTSVFCLQVCLGAHRYQQRMLDPLVLELQTVVSSHVDTGS